MKLLSIVGTRPQFIKTAPIVSMLIWQVVAELAGMEGGGADAGTNVAV